MHAINFDLHQLCVLLLLDLPLSYSVGGAARLSAGTLFAACPL